MSSDPPSNPAFRRHPLWDAWLSAARDAAVESIKRQYPNLSSEVEDAAQDVTASIFSNHTLVFQQQESVQAYFKTALKHRVFDQYKMRLRRRSLHKKATQSQTPSHTDSTETVEYITAILRMFTPAEVHLLRRHYADKVTLAQLTAETGCSKSSLHRELSDLAKRFTSLFNEG